MWRAGAERVEYRPEFLVHTVPECYWQCQDLSVHCQSDPKLGRWKEQGYPGVTPALWPEGTMFSDPIIGWK